MLLMRIMKISNFDLIPKCLRLILGIDKFTNVNLIREELDLQVRIHLLQSKGLIIGNSLDMEAYINGKAMVCLNSRCLPIFQHFCIHIWFLIVVL